jgi:hypothetical protein
MMPTPTTMLTRTMLQMSWLVEQNVRSLVELGVDDSLDHVVVAVVADKRTVC